MPRVRQFAVTFIMMMGMAFAVWPCLTSLAQAREILSTDAPLTYDRAETILAQNKDKPEYKKYLEEFQQWDENLNTSLRSKNQCAFKGSSASETVSLLLVITAKGVIAQALPDKDSEKAICIQQAYVGLKVKPPPFTPFVMQFITGGLAPYITH